MRVSCSVGVRCEFPDIEVLLDETKRVCREKDRNIRVRDLFVDVRLSKSHDKFNGWAHPEEYSVRRNQFRWHENGWIQMSLGFECSDLDIVRLFSHELRHISQFNRGLRKFGILTIEPMTPQESEDDAYDFEERILELM